MVNSGMKIGFESEGPMLGRRTVFACWPQSTIQDTVDAAVKQSIDCVYFCVGDDFESFVHHFLRSLLAPVVTLDFPYSQEDIMVPVGTVSSTCLQFMRAELDSLVKRPSPLWLASPNTRFIKLVCEEPETFYRYVDKANEFALSGHTVLLMPDFLLDLPHALGNVMMQMFDSLHPRVRCMPPVHHVLGMP